MTDHELWVQRSEERLRNEQVVEERLGPFKTFRVGARNYDEMKRQALEVFDIADLISGKYMRQCRGCISFDGRHHCEGFWPGMFLDEAAAEIERLRSQIVPSVPIGGDSIEDSRDSAKDLSNRADLVAQLRDRACPAGLPHTGDNPKDDHGHTDCWLHHQAADEIERLSALIAE